MRKEYKMTEEHKKKISISNTGKKFSDERRYQMVQSMKNRNMKGSNSPSWKGGKPKCIFCNNILSSYAYKMCRNCILQGKLKGELHPLWKGGLTPIALRIRHSIKYKNWRKSVFERDNYMCQICKKIGGELNVDHIKPFALYPDLRFDMTNGRTLCIECHKKTDTYLWKVKSKKIIG